MPHTFVKWFEDRTQSMTAVAPSFLPFSQQQRPQQQQAQQQQQQQQLQEFSSTALPDDFNMLGDDVIDLFEFSNLSQFVFNEPAVGGHFYPPLQLAALESAALFSDISVIPQAAAAIIEQDVKPIISHMSPVSSGMSAVPHMDTVAAMSLVNNTRMSITSPLEAAAAAAAIRALPHTVTPTSKKGSGTKQEQQQKRRERNRVLAKRTRLRKKFIFQSLQTQVSALNQENVRLREIIKSRCGARSTQILRECGTAVVPQVVAACAKQATALLQKSDFVLMKALQSCQPSFCVSDPGLPDCPIVYASDGFIQLTGYTRAQVLGRNCRFLQGPDTDPDMVAKLRKGIEEGRDTDVFLKNYNADGKPFFNHVFVAALRNSSGKVINYVGIQHIVSKIPSDSLLDSMTTESDSADLDDDDV